MVTTAPEDVSYTPPPVINTTAAGWPDEVTYTPTTPPDAEDSRPVDDERPLPVNIADDDTPMPYADAEFDGTFNDVPTSPDATFSPVTESPDAESPRPRKPTEEGDTPTEVDTPTEGDTPTESDAPADSCGDSKRRRTA